MVTAAGTLVVVAGLRQVLREVEAGEFTDDEVEQEVLTRRLKATIRALEREFASASTSEVV